MNQPAVENKTFIVLLVAISIAFIWLLLPFFSAILWGVILAILFTPFNRRLTQILKQRKNIAAFITLIIILLLVILPLTFLVMALINEASALILRIQNGEQHYGETIAHAVKSLPKSAQVLLSDYDLHDAESVQKTITEALMGSANYVANHVFAIGQNTFQFVVACAVMLYLLYFLLRDGLAIGNKVKDAIPLGHGYREHFLEKFIAVIKATVKGNFAISAIQGILGGLMFWALDVRGALLWGFVMMILSLLPAVGASLVWAPVAVYFFLVGDIMESVLLSVFGIFVLGLIDNFLRPILVGRDTQLPDYLVLISTLGGLSLLGLNGFVIGPLIAALFIAAWSLFTDSRSPTTF